MVSHLGILSTVSKLTNPAHTFITESHKSDIERDQEKNDVKVGKIYAHRDNGIARQPTPDLEAEG